MQRPAPRLLLPFKPMDADLQDAQTDLTTPSYTFFDALITSLEERIGQNIQVDIPDNPQDTQLLDLAKTNAQEEIRRKENSTEVPLLEKIAQALQLPKPPQRIECVDVSHEQGAETRVGLIVYIAGQPSKQDYRQYAMPNSQDDYLTMQNWVQRRLASGPPWPDLLLLDGGLGQLNVVSKALEDAGRGQLFPLAAIAKARDAQGQPDRRKGNVSDRIFIPGRTNPLNLASGSRELLFLQQMRDAAHNFCKGKHHQAHNKAQLSSKLLALPHVGPATAKLLWQKFSSLEEMRAASLKDLQELPGIGAAKAAKLLAALQTI